MADFKKWISYLYAYSGEVKGNNVGFARVEVRDGQCRLTIGIKGAYGCDTKGLNVGIYIRRQGRPQRIAVGTMRIREGSGEFGEVTEAEDLFGKGISLEDCGGLWLTSSERETIYLASWEKVCLDVREFLPVEAEDPSEVHVEITAAENASCCKNCSRDCGQAFSSLEQLPQPSLW
ncbi:MAG: hypothetical protein J6I64_02685, partial [Lachnospiraceae bacterium]|nr:hypothetical protein [Lachnospiraceae bacterium]